MTLKNMAIFFYFMTFNIKFHILAKTVDFYHFYVLAILEDILTEKEKNEKYEKVAPCQCFFGQLLPFFHFQSGNVSKFQKSYKRKSTKVSKKAQKYGARFPVLHVNAFM